MVRVCRESNLCTHTMQRRHPSTSWWNAGSDKKVQNTSTPGTSTQPSTSKSHAHKMANCKKPTYESAILAAVTGHGVLSRAAVEAKLSERGLENAQQLKATLKRLKDADKLQNEGASYMLGNTVLDKLSVDTGKQYETALQEARNGRKAESDAKQAGKKREAMRVAKALKAARNPGKICKRRDIKLLNIGLLAGL